MEIIVVESYRDLSARAALILKQTHRGNGQMVLGLPAGSTPRGLYEELVRLYVAGEIDFSNMITFNIDEYIGFFEDHPESFAAFVRKNLLNHVNIPKQNSFFPSATMSNCRQVSRNYEKLLEKSGGMDLVYLGIGKNGHVGFNEPGSSRESVTRSVRLSEETIERNRSYFQGRDVHGYAITMGVSTIMKARKCVLLVSGRGKAEIIERAIHGPITPTVPASFLQEHPSVIVILDREAAAVISG